MGGIEPGGPGRPGGRFDGARGGGAGGSIRGEGLATRLPFDFAGEFDDIALAVVAPTVAPEPERAGRTIGVSEPSEGVRYHHVAPGVNARDPGTDCSEPFLGDALRDR